MYIPRELMSSFYTQLKQNYTHQSAPVVILVALDPDALCACHILTALLRRDFIQHHIQPISGYKTLSSAGEKFVRPLRTTEGGTGGTVVCLGLGGLVDLEEYFGLQNEEGSDFGGVEIWVVDARRPWNLSNVFGMIESFTPGVQRGLISTSYKHGNGGVVVFDDGDIAQHLEHEKEAYCELADMPDLGEESDDALSESEHGGDNDDQDEGVPQSGQHVKKRKSSSDDETESEAEEGTPRKRRRSNSSTSIPSSPETRPAARGLLVSNSELRSYQRSNSAEASNTQTLPIHKKEPSTKSQRKQLTKLHRKYTEVLKSYYSLGQYYSEPVSSMMYSLASDMGLADNEILWNAIVGVTSLELSGRTSKGLGLASTSPAAAYSGWNRSHGEMIKAQLRDEVNRLNPPDPKDLQASQNGVIPTTARGPADKSIRLSPEPRFLLIRHWSLYDSMLHSPYLSAKLQIWSDTGRRRLHKLLAKMGVSLTQCKSTYTHMDMDLKRNLREKLMKFAPQYGLDGLVPQQLAKSEGREGWGFVRCWGFKACLSAVDVGTIIGAILEVGDMTPQSSSGSNQGPGANSQMSAQDGIESQEAVARAETGRENAMMSRFQIAFDALDSSKSAVSKLTTHITTAQHLYRAILRTGTSLLEKKQIKHLRAFRMAVVREGPDVALFTHPGALIKLGLWLAEAIAEMEGLQGKKGAELVVAGLDEPRGVYVIVGLGGGAGVLAQKEKEKRKAERRKERDRKREERKTKQQEKKRLRRERLESLGEEYDSALEDESEGEDDTESEGESDSEVEEELHERGKGINRFNNAFAEVIEETNARVRLDSFEHSVAEVRKDELAGFLEALSMRVVVG